MPVGGACCAQSGPFTNSGTLVCRIGSLAKTPIISPALNPLQADESHPANRFNLLAIGDDIAPGLTSRYGIGSVSAAQAIVTFSHPGRCRSEAAFAALGGTSPCRPAAAERSGTGLNRGGDRALSPLCQAVVRHPTPENY
jgi:transposase IS116/IS110/IS902 family protein